MIAFILSLLVLVLIIGFSSVETNLDALTKELREFNSRSGDNDDEPQNKIK